MVIKLTDAAKYYNGLDHQIKAWDWLQGQLTSEQLNGFGSRYRNNEEKNEPTKESFSNTWEGVLAAGKKAGAKFPECVAAQWALESGWGQHTSGKNNYFGLKGSGSNVNTQEFINGKWVTIKAGFIDFPDLLTCIQYLVDRWYKDFQVYKGVNRATSRNECAQLLVKEGYATDPDYGIKLIQIMDRQLETPGGDTPATTEKTLVVPYFYQLDNHSGQGSRECFSSSCAMIAAFYGKVKTDDEYNQIRKKFGDTTNSSAQLNTLRSLGLTAKFVTNANSALIENEIRHNRPVAVGWLHQGNVSKPTGGGHWSVVRGFTPTHFIHNDPYGEANMVAGGYTSNKLKAGDGIKYSRKNWLRRWEVEGRNTGWAILVNK
jgi:hypothetical protein